MVGASAGRRNFDRRYSAVATPVTFEKTGVRGRLNGRNPNRQAGGPAAVSPQDNSSDGSGAIKESPRLGTTGRVWYVAQVGSRFLCSETLCLALSGISTQRVSAALIIVLITRQLFE